MSYTDFKYSGLNVRVSIPKRALEVDAAAAVTAKANATSVAAQANATVTADVSSVDADKHPKPPTTVVPPGGAATLWKTAATVTFSVKNTGKFDGHEVPQVYLSYPPSAGEPPRVLRGFTRELIRRGQSKLISLQLRKRDISIWDVVTQEWVVPKGRFTVSVGASSRDIRQSTTFTV